jgi:glycosyltransferase involved in cell wall biosynthesis
MRLLVAIPVHNEQKYARSVLASVLRYTRPLSAEVLVVDDGSRDRTPAIVAEFPVRVVRHARNMGYGRSLIDAFGFAAREGHDWVLTMDCDEQHEPSAIPMFAAEIGRAEREGLADGRRVDVISGSRYLVQTPLDDLPPADRRRVNQVVTSELNRTLRTRLTDGFCGFKAHRVSAMDGLSLTENGYAFPMQFWIQAAAARLGVREVPVKRIYNDATRTFGGNLDDEALRLAHYRGVMDAELSRVGLGPRVAAAKDRTACVGTHYGCA